MDKMSCNSSPRCSQGVSKSNGATIYICYTSVKSKFSFNTKVLSSKCFIDLWREDGQNELQTVDTKSFLSQQEWLSTSLTDDKQNELNAIVNKLVLALTLIT